MQTDRPYFFAACKRKRTCGRGGVAEWSQEASLSDPGRVVEWSRWQSTGHVVTQSSPVHMVPSGHRWPESPKVTADCNITCQIYFFKLQMYWNIETLSYTKVIRVLLFSPLVISLQCRLEKVGLVSMFDNEVWCTWLWLWSIAECRMPGVICFSSVQI